MKNILNKMKKILDKMKKILNKIKRLGKIRLRFLRDDEELVLHIISSVGDLFMLWAGPDKNTLLHKYFTRYGRTSNATTSFFVEEDGYLYHFTDIFSLGHCCNYCYSSFNGLYFNIKMKITDIPEDVYNEYRNAVIDSIEKEKGYETTARKKYEKLYNSLKKVHKIK